MRLFTTEFLAVVGLTVPLASAHGRITNITTSSGDVYQGFDPASPKPSLVAWSASNLGNVFVPPSAFNTSSISCHFNATPGRLAVPVNSSSTLKLQWNEWPASHKGPVLTYLAACNGSCSSANAATLKWNKIDELGWINGSDPDGMGLGGTWATDVLRRNNASWMVQVPEGLIEGEYVLRNEIMALHVAEMVDGAQAYPQCVNLKISGGKGNKELDGGVVGSQLYGEHDKGILVSIHGNVTGYSIPGPEIWKGATRARQPGQA